MAATLCLALPAVVFAQKENKEKDKSKDAQVIVITRKGDIDNKTVVEIKGDKVTVNGKEVNNDKSGDVSVNVHRYKDIENVSPRVMARVPGGFNFNMDNDNISLFSEDANRAMLGVVTDSDDKGARITQVSKESAAEKAGLKKDDIITKIDNKAVKDAGDVADVVHDHKPGDKINITILRDGKEQKVTAELGKWKGVRVQAFRNGSDQFRMTPEMWQRTPAPPNAPRVMPFEFKDFNIYSDSRPKIGMSVQDSEEGKGVKVIDVDDDSNAAKAGIKEDDIITSVNGQEVNSTDEITRIVRENRDKNSLSIKLLRKGKQQTVEVRMPRKIKTADL